MCENDGIFIIRTTSSGIDGNKLTRNIGDNPYITRTDSNNGISTFCCEQHNYSKDSGNCITIGLDTQTVFYQPKSFYTGQNIQILINKEMDEDVANFFLAPLKNTLSIFNWGSNGATLNRLKRAKVILPITNDSKPDYNFMKKYVQKIKFDKLNNYLSFIMQPY